MKLQTPACLRVSSQVGNALDGSDELVFFLMSPERDLQARGIAVLDQAHLQQPEKKTAHVMQLKTLSGLWGPFSRDQ